MASRHVGGHLCHAKDRGEGKRRQRMRFHQGSFVLTWHGHGSPGLSHEAGAVLSRLQACHGVCEGQRQPLGGEMLESKDVSRSRQNGGGEDDRARYLSSASLRKGLRPTSGEDKNIGMTKPRQTWDRLMSFYLQLAGFIILQWRAHGEAIWVEAREGAPQCLRCTLEPRIYEARRGSS